MNYDFTSVTIEIEYNISPVTVKSATLPPIDGRIVGMSTHTKRVGTTTPAKLQLKDGGVELYRPIDVAFSETEGRSTFMDGVIPLNISNPGKIEATLIIADAPANGEKIIVELLIISEK